MFKINTNDGLTIKADLADEEQAREVIRRLKSRKYQERITGISVVRNCTGKFRCSSCNKAAEFTCSRCGTTTKDAVCGIGAQYSISRPTGVPGVFYQIEAVSPDREARIRGGEKIICFAGDIKVVLMSHIAQPAARITLSKIGKRRYNPFVD